MRAESLVDNRALERLGVFSPLRLHTPILLVRPGFSANTGRIRISSVFAITTVFMVYKPALAFEYIAFGQR